MKETDKNYSTSYDILEKKLQENDCNTLLNWFTSAYIERNTSYCNKLDYFVSTLKLTSDNDYETYLTCLHKIIQSIKDTPYIPISPMLEVVLRANKICKDYLKSSLIKLIKDIYHDLNNNDRGVALQVLYIYSKDQSSFNYLIERILDFTDPGPDTMYGHEAIRAFESFDNIEIAHLVNIFSNFKFDFNHLRSIALVELFSILNYDGKISYHPLENYLDLVEDYINGDQESTKSSYIISILSALLFVKSDKTKIIFERALTFPNLEVNLEAAYCMVMKNVPQSIDLFTKYLLDPRISLKALNYLGDLEKELSKEFSECWYAVYMARKNPEFIAESSLAEWLTHPNEYGAAPDEIKTAFKTKYPNKFHPEHSKSVYFVRYRYLNENTSNIGCVIMHKEGTANEYGYPFSHFRDYNNLEEAISDYQSFLDENSGPVS